MSQVCRFCGQNTPNSLNLLKSPSVVANVEMCLARKVSSDDKLPIYCCIQCCSTLEKFASFIAMADATEKRLREMEEKVPPEIRNLPNVTTTRLVHRKRENKKISDTDEEQKEPKGDVTTIVKKLRERSDLTMTKIGMGSTSGETTEIPAVETAEKTTPPVTITNAPSSYLCMNCRDRFDSFDALSRHMKTPGQCQKKEHKCPTCSRTFDTRKKYYQHSITHRERSALICDQCGKSYTNRFNLENHKSSVHGDAVEESDSAIYRCRICMQQFTSRVELFRHIEAHDKVSRQLHLCDRCGKCFVSQEALKTHSRTHVSVHKRCPKCGENFTKKSSLALHECPGIASIGIKLPAN